MVENSVGFGDLICAVETSIAKARARAGRELGVILLRVELTVKVVAQQSVQAGLGGAAFTFVPVTVSGARAEENVQEFHLDLVPTGLSAELGDESDQLADAIVAAARELKAVSMQSTNFEAGRLSVALGVQVEKKGGVQVVIGGSREGPPEPTRFD